MSSSGDNSPEPAVDMDGGVSMVADVLGAVDIAEELSQEQLTSKRVIQKVERTDKKFPKLQWRCSGRTERA